MRHRHCLQRIPLFEIRVQPNDREPHGCRGRRARKLSMTLRITHNHSRETQHGRTTSHSFLQYRKIASPSPKSAKIRKIRRVVASRVGTGCSALRRKTRIRTRKRKRTRTVIRRKANRSQRRRSMNLRTLPHPMILVRAGAKVSPSIGSTLNWRRSVGKTTSGAHRGSPRRTRNLACFHRFSAVGGRRTVEMVITKRTRRGHCPLTHPSASYGQMSIIRGQDSRSSKSEPSTAWLTSNWPIPAEHSILRSCSATLCTLIWPRFSRCILTC